LMTVKMSGSEWQFVMCVIRKTYGFNKKEDWITGSQIVKETGLVKERVSETKKKLLARNIVTEKRNKIAIQKNYEKWVELRKSVTIVTEKRNKVLRKSVNTIDKRYLLKDISDSSESLKEKDMWKRQPDDEDEVSIDYDSGETIKDPVLEEKAENKKITNNLKVLGEMRDLPFINLPTQRKRYKQLLVLGYTHLQIADEYEKLLVSEYWKKEKKENKRLPDMNSLYSNLSNKIKDE